MSRSGSTWRSELVGWSGSLTKASTAAPAIQPSSRPRAPGLALRPLPAAELGFVVLDALEQHQEEADGRLGHRDEILRRGAVGDEDAEPRGCIDVDLVGADEGHDDETECRG